MLSSDRSVTRRGTCIYTRLHQLARLTGRHYDAELGEVGLRTSQFLLLTHVLELGPSRPSDLAKAMQLDPSTLTRKLKPLLGSGWLEMREGADGRTRSVSITRSGHKKHSEGLRHWLVAEARLDDLLGADIVMRLDAFIEDSVKQILGRDRA
jgi:DNA-binding MarR family transcriptional regulator